MKLQKLLGAVIVAASTLAVTAPTHADDQLRGGMTSVKSVAGALATQTKYVDYKWANGRAVSPASAPKADRGDNFKWAKRPSSEGHLTAQVASNDSSEARHKWRIKADADQARHKWRIKADADQARHKWRIKADADQARHKWRIKADADQARHKWRIK